MLNLLLLTLITTTETAEIDLERSPTRANSILSARGPLVGEGAVSFATSFIATPSAPVPSLDFRWLRGVSDLFQTELQIRTMGLVTFAELGGRFRLVEGEYFSLALRPGAHGMVGVFPEEEDSNVFAGGAGAAIILSAGPEWFQWTAVAEVRLWLNNEGEVFPGTKSAVGVEFPLGPPLNAFFEAQLLTNFIDGEARQLLIATHGIAF